MKNENKAGGIHRLTFSAVMLALATALALVCAFIPFLHLPYGGGFTLASMLPIVIVSYVYGIKWGLFTSLTYAAIQIVMDLMAGKSSVIIAFFLPDSDQTIIAAIAIIIIDYIIAYGVLGIGGVFRKGASKTKGLVLGSVIATSARYIAHIISGYIFYGAYAEWFFTESFDPDMGAKILGTFDGELLALIYSVIYNGLYMIPEIVITAVCAAIISRLPQIKAKDLYL